MYLLQYYYDAPTTIFGLSLLTFFFLFFGLGIVLCFVCGNMLKEKGYDMIVGILLGFFLGIVGLVICLVMPPKQDYRGRGRFRDDCDERRPRGRPGSRRRTPAKKGSNRGYRPVRTFVKSLNDTLNNPSPQQAIPKTYETKEIACPHCGNLLYVSMHAEYTCPECEDTFIY